MAESLQIDSLFSVEGKVALVTGGGTGLGHYIARALATNGARVYIVGRRKEKLDEAVANWGSKDRGELIALPGDVSTKESITKLVAAFAARESKLNILVNAAGILRPEPVKSHPDDTNTLVESLLSTPWDDWTDSMSLNVSSLYFTSVAFAPYLHAAYNADPSSEAEPKESPCVINIGSIAGFHNARDAAPVSYQVSKSAVVHLTTCLATRFLPLRIRVNALAPGLFPSEMTNTDPATIRQTHKTHFKAMPEGRAGAPPDIAGPVLFLTSRAGAYVNGNTLDVGGGRSLLLSGSIIA